MALAFSFPDKDFHFDRLGIRVPMLVISPWVAKGQVVGAPTHGPTPTSEYEATSILSTIKNLFDLPHFLTKRDAWVRSFAHSLIRSRSENAQAVADFQRLLRSI